LTSGTIVTASRISREQEQSRRRGVLTSSAYYYVQPAWAEGPIALPEEEIAAIGYRAANEAPLSLLPQEVLANRRLLAPAASSAAARPTNSPPLVTAGRSSDLGIAAHAESALAFELPAEALALETAVGFSPEVGTGGCVRCKVKGDQAEGSTLILWDSGVFEGKDGLQSSGALDVAGLRRVILVTEFAHEERPSGADPLDIRDSVVWLAPLLKLDFGDEAARKRALALLPGAADWQVVSSGATGAQFGCRWNVPASQWDPLVTLPPKAKLVLTREHSVNVGSDVVELLTACPVELSEHDFELKVNGAPVPWRNNADRNQLRQWVLRYGRQRAAQGDEGAATADRLAYWWDLQAWRGQKVELALTLKGRGERSEVAWRKLAVRGAIGNLPESRDLPKPDVPLASLAPREQSAGEQRKSAASAGAANGGDEAIRFLGQKFAAGHRLARGSRLSFDVPDGCDEFIAVAGCTWQTAGPLRVLVDGQVAWERTAVNSLDSAELIELLLPAGAKTLTLESAAVGTHYGLAAFANAGFRKRP
jgi:hypothetical protein